MSARRLQDRDALRAHLGREGGRDLGAELDLGPGVIVHELPEADPGALDRLVDVLCEILDAHTPPGR